MCMEIIVLLVALRLPPLTLIASIGSFGSVFFAALIHGEFISVGKVFLQYIFMLLTYVNMFSVYSFSNMHDISWGTKEGVYQCRLA
jgi:chitin synthase